MVHAFFRGLVDEITVSQMKGVHVCGFNCTSAPKGTTVWSNEESSIHVKQYSAHGVTVECY